MRRRDPSQQQHYHHRTATATTTTTHQPLTPFLRLCQYLRTVSPRSLRNLDVVFLEGAINDRPSTCESAQRLLHCVEALVLTIRAVSPFATIVFVELAEWRKVIGMVVKNGNPGQLPYSTTAALHDPATCAAFRESTAKMTPLARDESTRAARVEAARSDPTWCLSSVKMNNRTVAGGAPLHEPVALAHSLPIVSLPHAIRAALDDHAQAGLAPLPPPPPLVRSMEEAAQLCADSSNKGLRLVACDAFHVGRLGHTVAAALIAQLVERGREVARAAKHEGACAALRDHAVRVGGEAAMPEVRSIATAEQLADFTSTVFTVRGVGSALTAV